LTVAHAAVLDSLLTKPPNSTTTSFNRLKQASGPATAKTVTLWIDRLDWLNDVIDPNPFLQGIAHTKLRQFAAEAAALDVSDLLAISRSGERHTLLLALLRQARMRGRDELIEMMLRRVRRTQAAAKEQLEASQATPRSATTSGNSWRNRAASRRRRSSARRCPRGTVTTTCRCSGRSMPGTAACCSGYSI
jgi:hypothetical protein